MRAGVSLLVLSLMFSNSVLADTEVKFSGVGGVEARWFIQDALQGQDDFSSSIMIEPEWHFSWENSSLTIKPFIRWDSMDEERSHGDLREFYWQYVAEDWEVTVGIDKVFWASLKPSTW